MKNLFVIAAFLLVFIASTGGSMNDTRLKQPGSGNPGLAGNEASKAPGNETSKAPGFTDIKPEDAKVRLDNEKGIILLDVRTYEEYSEKHIRGSILIPVDEIESRASGILTSKNAEIFVYCRSGRRSVTASLALVEMGYTRVYNLGGIIDWPYETETGAPG